MSNGTSATPALWALLIGIDEYQAVRDLRGCVADVEALHRFLTREMGVPETQIRVLRNGEATRAGILAAFRDFLISNDEIPHGAQLLVHYSGHGTRMRDHTGTEPDGRNEALVPHDSRSGDVFDIPDKTLAAMLTRLAEAKGNHITIVLDACHSGSGTRDVDAPGAALSRRIPDDDRVPPPELDEEWLDGGASRSAGPSGWTKSPDHVLIAGCRDYEESKEYSPEPGLWMGAMSFHLLEYLRSAPQEATYRDLHEWVAARVNALYHDQMPQCEGQRDRTLFGGLEIARDPFYTVREITDGTVTLDGGLAHGLRVGTRLALYPPETRSRADLPDPLATVEITAVRATSATATVLDEAGESAPEIPEFARALISEQVHGSRQRVALSPADLAPLDDSPYLEAVDDEADADLIVRAAAGEVTVHDAAGTPLVDPAHFGADPDPQTVVDALETIARYRSLLALDNDDERSALRGRVSVALRRRADGTRVAREDDDESITIYFDETSAERNLYEVEITNHGSTPVFAALFILNPDYSILHLYPTKGQEERIEPGATLRVGSDASGEGPVSFFLPPGWDSARDTIKVVVTPEPARLGILAQPGIGVPIPRGRSVGGGEKSPLERLLEQVADGSRARFAAPTSTGATADWAVVTFPLTLVRGFNARTMEAPAAEIALGDGLTLDKPEGFAGRVTLTTIGQGSRGAEGDPTLAGPPGLEAFSDHFAPLTRAGTRNVGQEQLVLAFEGVDESARAALSHDSPLRIRVGDLASEDEEVWPVYFDGEDYLIGGSYADGAVELSWMPEPAAEPTARGIGRTVRLFLYRKSGRPSGDIGLRLGRMEGDEVVYDPVQPGMIKSGERVALMVHGFTSDTTWMVSGVARLLRRLGIRHDHVLTWDYESFGTGVEENAEKLATALREQAGLSADDGVRVDLFAHSMGGFLSRCMVELFGGHELIDAVVLAGAPSNGTTLASTVRGGLYLLSAAVGRASLMPPVAALKGVADAFRTHGVGVRDLEVGSELAKKINALDAPIGVPYFVLAGENLADPEAQEGARRLAAKLLDRSLDALFGEQNDVVIGLSSLSGVRGGAYTPLEVAVVPSDHFHYFSIRETSSLLRKWLR